MAYSICEPCIGTKDTACVDVCPVDCIHPRNDEEEFEAETMLYIHPEECIDCGACVPACPVEAIFVNDEVPDQWQSFIDTNARVREQILAIANAGDDHVCVPLQGSGTFHKTPRPPPIAGGSPPIPGPPEAEA